MTTVPQPDAKRVQTDVTRFVGGFTGVKADRIKPGWVLKDTPLAFDDNRLVYLAMSLRGYVQSFNESETVLASETRKAGRTVGAMADLVHEKIHS